MGIYIFQALKTFTEKRPPGPYHLEGIENFLQETYGECLPSQQAEYMQGVTDRLKGTVFEF